MRLAAAEDDIDAAEDQLKLGPGEMPRPFVQDAAVDRHDLRQVGDRVARQACPSGGELDVAESRGPAQVARQRNDDDGGEAALVERVTCFSNEVPPGSSFAFRPTECLT